MIELDFTVLISSVIAGAVPVLLATLGETINEKAGIIKKYPPAARSAAARGVLGDRSPRPGFRPGPEG